MNQTEALKAVAVGYVLESGHALFVATANPNPSGLWYSIGFIIQRTATAHFARTSRPSIVDHKQQAETEPRL